jgi:hypothetical protein
MNYINEPLFFTELVQFGDNLDCFVLLHFKDETIQYYGQTPDGDISVEIIPLMIDGENIFDPAKKSSWKVRTSRKAKYVVFGPGNIFYDDDGPFQYLVESMKGRGLGTHILSNLIEMSLVFLGEYGYDITMGAFENTRLENWYKSFGFREGRPNNHKGIINDLRTRTTNKPLNVLYSSTDCRHTCGFRKNLDKAEELTKEKIKKNEELKQNARFKERINDRMFLGHIGTFALSLIFIFLSFTYSQIAFIGFLLIILLQCFVVWQCKKISLPL